MTFRSAMAFTAVAVDPAGAVFASAVPVAAAQKVVKIGAVG